MAYSTVPFSTRGATLHISANLPATEDQAGYEDVGITYTQVGEIIDLGTIADETNLITYETVEDAIVKKLKGSRNYGTMAVQYARVFGDAGQVIVVTAVASTASFTFKVTLQDGTKIYFQAKVMNDPIEIGTVNDVVMSTVNLEIDTIRVRVEGS